jgi:hypothetical protein
VGFVSSSPFLPPFLGVVMVLVVVVVVLTIFGAVVAGRNGGVRNTAPAAYFLFGLSLVTLTVAVASVGMTVSALSQLVGPSSQSFAPPGFFPPCASVSPSTTSPATGSNSGAATTIVAPTTVVPGPLPQPPDGIPCPSTIGPGSIYSGVGFSNLTSPIDDSNHYISVAVAAALFGVVAMVGYFLAWRRARRPSSMGAGLGLPPDGRLPVSYGYLVAALAALSLLVFVPVAADSIFRAVAPGVNETSGHAGGLRSLVTFLTLSAVSAAILRYHLRYAAALRETSPPPGETGDPGIATESTTDDG